ncbi:hypothetical protein C6P40_003372 [Pichia californica]|uniref:Thioredoxin-like fold domain-containing protein n=1 Tax=Pichia californica TaxID=460514 RepID=A0A9P7BI27_9ASCO|nr:hypothetical protein C6P42_004436 [[Candida] californica]KAG0690258.1 hypothetical protein C6P40_003372 [[Candida] californica]
MTNLHPRYIKSHIFDYKPFANNIEIFLDFNCPFSAKLFIKIQDEILPLLKNKNLNNKYNIIFINVIQPWHGIQSSILHDVSFAICKISPENFLNISRIFFENIKKFYDSEINNKSRSELTNEIINLAINNDKCEFTSNEISEIKNLLEIKKSDDGEPSNNGNGVSKDNKYFTRYHRTLGIHITPSVVINGIFNSEIGSSTNAEKFIEIIENQCN